MEVFGRRVVCAKCGSRGNKIDVRPNWKEQPPSRDIAPIDGGDERRGDSRR